MTNRIIPKTLISIVVIIIYVITCSSLSHAVCYKYINNKELVTRDSSYIIQACKPVEYLYDTLQSACGTGAYLIDSCIISHHWGSITELRIGNKGGQLLYCGLSSENFDLIANLSPEIGRLIIMKISDIFIDEEFRPVIRYKRTNNYLIPESPTYKIAIFSNNKRYSYFITPGAYKVESRDFQQGDISVVFVYWFNKMLITLGEIDDVVSRLL